MALLNIFIGINLILIFFCIYMLYRNGKVARYRHKLVDQISLKATEDAKAHKDWHWRFEAYRSVSYDEMMLKFWKPLDSFYEDKRFLK